jgi:2-amino-4-hydroxy-6-hydroxymethyldihydropteridine diphosphokinase
MSRALISLGSNLGDRHQLLEAAIAELDSSPNIRVSAKSGWHETIPIGGPAGQGDFLNGAAELETSLSPRDLLAVLEKIEKKFGRQRVIRWAERPLDLDLLLFDQEIISSPELILPHPRMTFRRFVLEPAAEIAADWRLPHSNWTIEKLLANINRRPLRVTILGTASDRRDALEKKIKACRDEVVIFCMEQMESSPRDLPVLLIVLDDGQSPQTESLAAQIAAANLPAVLRLDTRDWPAAEAEALAAVLAV